MMKYFVYILKVWWNTLFSFQSNLFTFQKYDEILYFHFKAICLHIKSMMKYFVHISKVWWSSVFTFQKYDEILCLHNKSICLHLKWIMKRVKIFLWIQNVNKLFHHTKICLHCTKDEKLSLTMTTAKYRTAIARGQKYNYNELVWILTNLDKISQLFNQLV